MTKKDLPGFSDAPSGTNRHAFSEHADFKHVTVDLRPLEKPDGNKVED